jgi:hypothetical protein
MLRPSLFRSLGVVLLLAPLAGCVVPMTSSNTYMVPLSNGETMEMSIKNGGLTLADQDGIRIVEAGALNPSATKKEIVCTFQLIVKSGHAPKRILIEDMTEDPVRVVVDDPAPKLDAANHWKLTTPVLDAKDPIFAWLTQLDDTIRVYRFTVTLADGSQVVLKQPQMYPVFMKQLIRKMLGMDK